MKTILDIPDELLNEAMRLAHSKTKKDSVIIALEDFVRKKRIEEAFEMEGKLKFKKDWDRLRHER
ncbi:MAG: type II toxin-antitoxin system VapB family antitoxin [Deltaproteobacteria bacterium]|nr:type II toxin-antitoxin system VapB family antitoxin [Deltaproteobacteria bacterium]